MGDTQWNNRVYQYIPDSLVLLIVSAVIVNPLRFPNLQCRFLGPFSGLKTDPLQLRSGVTNRYTQLGFEYIHTWTVQRFSIPFVHPSLVLTTLFYDSPLSTGGRYQVLTYPTWDEVVLWSTLSDGLIFTSITCINQSCQVRDPNGVKNVSSSGDHRYLSIRFEDRSVLFLSL